MNQHEYMNTSTPFFGDYLKRFFDHLRNPLYRNSYALTLSSGVNSALGFVYWMYAARYYPTEIVGTSTATITAMTFISGLSALYMDGTLARFVPVAGKATGRFVLSVYIILIITGIVASGVFLAGINLWSPALSFLTSSGWLTLGFILSTVIWSIFNIQDGTIIGMRRAVWIPVENAIYAILKLTLLISLTNILPQYGILLSWIAPIALMITIVNIGIFRIMIPAHISVTKNIAKPVTYTEIVKYAGGNYIGMIFSLASTTLPPLMVLQLVGSRASAYFYMPWVIAVFFRVLATDTSTTLVVESVIEQNKSSLLFRLAFWNTARLVVPFVIACALAAPFILNIFGEDYAREGTPLLRFLAFASIPNIVVTLYIGWLRVRNKIHLVILFQFVIASLTLLLGYMWLQYYGIAGIGMSLLAVQTCMAILLLTFPLRFVFGSRLAALAIDETSS